MVRIIVTTNTRASNEHGVLLDEEVCPEHMSDEHAASQLLQRLSWAVNDADRAPAAAARQRLHPRARGRAPLDRVSVPHRL